MWLEIDLLNEKLNQLEDVIGRLVFINREVHLLMRMELNRADYRE